MWIKLTEQLNNLGPLIKDVTGWKNVSDLKTANNNNYDIFISLQTWKKLHLKSKSNKAAYMAALRQTGNIPPNVTLSETDERISHIYGQFGVAGTILKEIGVPGSQNDCFSLRNILAEAMR